MPRGTRSNEKSRKNTFFIIQLTALAGGLENVSKRGGGLRGPPLLSPLFEKIQRCRQNESF